MKNPYDLLWNLTERSPSLYSINFMAYSHTITPPDSYIFASGFWLFSVSLSKIVGLVCCFTFCSCFTLSFQVPRQDFFFFYRFEIIIFPRPTRVWFTLQLVFKNKSRFDLAFFYLLFVIKLINVLIIYKYNIQFMKQ